MIKKVLIAEDHESANLSVQKTLEELGVVDPHHVFYCDDALLKIQKANQDDDPYDLLITDLYYEEDSTRQKLKDGAALITAARKVQPELKVLVFTSEKKAGVIEMLFKKLAIDGLVQKARNDARELKSAIRLIGQNQRYFPRRLAQLIGKKNAHEFTPYDVLILSLMAKGMRQKDIPAYLHQQKISPEKLSSVEKRLRLIREVLEFTNNEQLIVYCKDMGIV
jgi:two-component system capsular synthesis response regulator RcsB